MSKIDDLYDWIKKVINSCDDISQIEPCGELIDIFERRKPPEYLVKSLRELLKIIEQSVISKKKITDNIKIKEKIYDMHIAGHSPVEISEMLGVNYQFCIDTLNKKRKSGKK